MAEVSSSDQVAEQAVPTADAAPADEKPSQNGNEQTNLLNARAEAKGNGVVEATADGKKSAEDATAKDVGDAGSKDAGAKGESKDADDKEADGDDSDESSSDEELVGEFDNPMTILEGKRSRKSTTRIDDAPPPKVNEAEEKRKREQTYEGGNGVKLADIAYVNKELRGEPQDDLLPLHKLCYGPRFNAKRARFNLLEFSGFSFDKNDNEFKKRETFLQRFMKEGLKYICGLLGVDVIKREDVTTEVDGVSTTNTTMVSMSAEEMRVVLANFLLKPYDTGLTPNAPVPVVRAPKPKTPQQKKPAAEAGSAEPKKRRRSKKKSIDAVEEVAKSPKSPKKSEPTQVRIGVPKKKRASDAAPKDNDNDSEDDDAPLSKKKKNEPTNDEIRTIIEQFLDGADLNLVTMKIVCRHVFDTYAPLDLVAQKDFIKNTVKDIIQSS